MKGTLPFPLRCSLRFPSAPLPSYLSLRLLQIATGCYSAMFSQISTCLYFIYVILNLRVLTCVAIRQHKTRQWISNQPYRREAERRRSPV